MDLSRFCVVMGLLMGCASAQRTAPVRPAAPASIRLSLQVIAADSSRVGGYTLVPGATLHSRDRFGLRLWVDRPAYVYALKYAPATWSTRLFPERGEVRMPAGVKVEVPGNGDKFVLDDEAGDEIVIVVASPRPVASDVVLCRELRIPCTAGTTGPLTRGGPEATPPPPPPPPPAGVGPDKRGGELVSDDRGLAMQVQGQPGGVALLRFAFRHVH